MKKKVISIIVKLQIAPMGEPLWAQLWVPPLTAMLKYYFQIFFSLKSRGSPRHFFYIWSLTYNSLKKSMVSLSHLFSILVLTLNIWFMHYFTILSYGFFKSILKVVIKLIETSFFICFIDIFITYLCQKNFPNMYY